MSTAITNHSAAKEEPPDITPSHLPIDQNNVEPTSDSPPRRSAHCPPNSYSDNSAVYIRARRCSRTPELSNWVWWTKKEKENRSPPIPYHSPTLPIPTRSPRTPSTTAAVPWCRRTSRRRPSRPRRPLDPDAPPTAGRSAPSPPPAPNHRRLPGSTASTRRPAPCPRHLFSGEPPAATHRPQHLLSSPPRRLLLFFLDVPPSPPKFKTTEARTTNRRRPPLTAPPRIPTAASPRLWSGSIFGLPRHAPAGRLRCRTKFTGHSCGRTKFQPYWNPSRSIGKMIHNPGEPVHWQASTPVQLTVWWAASKFLGMWLLVWRAGKQQQAHQPQAKLLAEKNINPCRCPQPWAVQRWSHRPS